MAISNIPMPSFTLVLTSGHCSHRRHPTTIRCDTLSSAPDRLMKTIDLRNEPEDDQGYYTDVSTTSFSQEDSVDLPVKEAELFRKKAGHSIKANLLRFLHKFIFKGRLAFFKESSSST